MTSKTGKKLSERPQNRRIRNETLNSAPVDKEVTLETINKKLDIITESIETIEASLYFLEENFGHLISMLPKESVKEAFGSYHPVHKVIKKDANEDFDMESDDDVDKYEDETVYEEEEESKYRIEMERLARAAERAEEDRDDDRVECIIAHSAKGLAMWRNIWSKQ